jgi:KipI family sensor histidine kinase inhibitor
MSTVNQLRPYGDQAVLVEPSDPRDVLGLLAAATEVAGVVEAVPAARTVLVRFDTRLTSAETIGRALESYAPAPAGETATDPMELRIHYDGPDLASVADEVGMSVPELIRRHAGAEYTVVFCGFAPGFAYLSGLDPALRVGRLAEPRTTVPAGSVGIAGEYTGVYPRSSPGGWRLLGSTDAPLWDTRRTPPALLTPGGTVRFRPA